MTEKEKSAENRGIAYSSSWIKVIVKKKGLILYYIGDPISANTEVGHYMVHF